MGYEEIKYVLKIQENKGPEVGGKWVGIVSDFSGDIVSRLFFDNYEVHGSDVILWYLDLRTSGRGQVAVLYNTKVESLVVS